MHDDDEELDFRELGGALATLRWVEPGEKMLETFLGRSNLRKMIGLEKEPDLERLQDLVEDEELGVWDVFPEGTSTSVGFAMLTSFDGPPAVCFYTFTEEEEISLAQDVLMQLVKFFFEWRTEEPCLYFYRDGPVEEEIHDLLIDYGFDLVEENPTAAANEVSYVLERHTYDAYYGGAVEEEDYNFKGGY